jgi:hypothetical protein
LQHLVRWLKKFCSIHSTPSCKSYQLLFSSKTDLDRLSSSHCFCAFLQFFLSPFTPSISHPVISLGTLITSPFSHRNRARTTAWSKVVVTSVEISKPLANSQ